MTAIRQFLLAVLFAAVSGAGALAQEAVGSLTAGSGEILIIGAGGEEQPGNVGTAVNQYDTIYVGSGGEATVTFVDDTILTLSGGSALIIDELVYDPGNQASVGLFTLVGGAMGLVSGDILKTGDMTVTTPVSTIGIRGTAVLIDSGTTVVWSGSNFILQGTGTSGETVTLVVSPDGTMGVVQVTNRETGETRTLSQFGDTVTTTVVNGRSAQTTSKLTSGEIKTKFARVLLALQAAVGKDLGDPANATEADNLQDALDDLFDEFDEASPD